MKQTRVYLFTARKLMAVQTLAALFLLLLGNNSLVSAIKTSELKELPIVVNGTTYAAKIKDGHDVNSMIISGKIGNIVVDRDNEAFPTDVSMSPLNFHFAGSTIHATAFGKDANPEEIRVACNTAFSNWKTDPRPEKNEIAFLYPVGDLTGEEKTAIVRLSTYFVFRLVHKCLIFGEPDKTELLKTFGTENGKKWHIVFNHTFHSSSSGQNYSVHFDFVKK